MIRSVVRLPDRVLKQPAAAVGRSPYHGLLDDLVQTMRASPACVGLAAPQVGVSVRAIVVDASAHAKTTTSHGLVVLIDPVIVSAEGRVVGREGCMSVPDLTANVARAKSIVVEGAGTDGAATTIETEGFEARVFQHEIDHLDGLLILDRVESLTHDVFQRRVYR